MKGFAFTFEGALGLLVVEASWILGGNQLQHRVVGHLLEKIVAGSLFSPLLLQLRFVFRFDGRPGHMAPHFHQVSLCRKLQLDLSPESKHFIKDLKWTSSSKFIITYHPILSSPAWSWLWPKGSVKSYWKEKLHIEIGTIRNKHCKEPNCNGMLSKAPGWSPRRSSGNTSCRGCKVSSAQEAPSTWVAKSLIFCAINS